MSTTADGGPDGMKFSPSTGLEYQFWEKQRVVLEELEGGEADVVAFLAGYRSGKSVTGARWVISKALELSGTRWLAMAQDFEKGSSTTYRVLFENLPGERTHILTSDFNGPEQSPIVRDYNRKNKRLTLVNDSIIQLGSADYWARYAGDEYSGIWLDEPSHYGDELFDMREMLSTRLSAKRGPGVQFWSLTGNGYNSAWKILEKRQDASGDEIGDKIKVIRGSVLENPFIPDKAKARFKRQFSGTGREEQALFGGFAAQEGLVYDVKRGEQVVSRDVFGDRLPPIDPDYRVFGYDAGWKDPRVVLELGRTIGDGDLVVLDEFYETKTKVGEAIDWTLEKPRGSVAAEHEPSEIDDMQKAGLDAFRADKSLEPGIAEVSSRFNPRDDETGEPLPPSLYVIEETCENLVRELYTYKEDEIGGTDVKDHAADALRYAVMAVKNGNDGGIGVGSVSTH